MTKVNIVGHRLRVAAKDSLVTSLKAFIVSSLVCPL